MVDKYTASNKNKNEALQADRWIDTQYNGPETVLLEIKTTS